MKRDVIGGKESGTTGLEVSAHCYDQCPVKLNICRRSSGIDIVHINFTFDTYLCTYMYVR